MPTKTTPSGVSRRAAAASLSASARHGGHQAPHTLTTITLPAYAASETESPCRVSPLTAPGCLRCATGRTVITPSPSTYPLSPVPAVLPHPLADRAMPASRVPAVRRVVSERALGMSAVVGFGAGGPEIRVTVGRFGPPWLRLGTRSGLEVVRRDEPGAGREGGLALRHRDQVAGGLGVADRHEPVAVEVQRGEAAEGALALARVVEVALALGPEAADPDRQLMGDDHGLVTGRRDARVLDGRPHPVGHLGVRLTPGRAERVHEVAPHRRAPHEAALDREGPALEDIR